MNTKELKNTLLALAQALNELPEDTALKANLANPWFTPEFIQLACRNWALALEAEKLDIWLKDLKPEFKDKTAGIIMAGNIPLVGLHDLLCVLACGIKASVKLSSTDEVLMTYAITALCKASPALSDRIRTDGNMKGVNALIATGSNNTARYFEYYFRDLPCLIRKNRTSVAVLSGQESDETLLKLADDIYTYFGLGCRNVTHLILPRNTDLHRLYQAYDKYMNHVHHHKYYNNYMYHKSIFLMNLDKHYDNGFMIFRENTDPHAAVATLNYHFYDDIREAAAYLEQHRDKWQCIVSETEGIAGSIPFGSTQKPELWDYADNVNVPEFLESCL